MSLIFITYFPQLSAWESVNILYKKIGLYLRSHGRNDNYETTWSTDIKTFLLTKPSRTFFCHCSLSFCIFSLTLLVLHFFGRAMFHPRIQLLRFSAHLFTIFLHTRISQFPIYYQFVIDLILSSIFCNRR